MKRVPTEKNIEIINSRITAERISAAEDWHDRNIEVVRAGLSEKYSAGIVTHGQVMAAYAYKLEHEAVLRCIAIVCDDCRTRKHGGVSCVKARELWDVLQSL